MIPLIYEMRVSCLAQASMLSFIKQKLLMEGYENLTSLAIVVGIKKKLNYEEQMRISLKQGERKLVSTV